jgi:ATP-dependent RNA helicase DeaD
METQEVADLLIRDGYNAEALHGDLSQAQRDLTMQKFRQHRTQLLVATDVAARGLDVDELTHVINYGLPDDVENYTHRSGRTGRAGKRGTSISIIHLREKHKVRVIEKVIGKKFEAGTLPDPKEICTKQLYRVIDQMEHTEVDEAQIAPFLPEVFRKLEWLSKEDLIKRVVTLEFGRFLQYYANAPEIEQPSAKGKDAEAEGNRRAPRPKGEKGGPRQAEAGYKRLFINLGKRDNFYAREIINLVNRYVKGKIEIGRIDLTANCSFFEVPEADAPIVLRKMAKAMIGDRKVVVDHAEREEGAAKPEKRGEKRESRGAKPEKRGEKKAEKKADRKAARAPKEAPTKGSKNSRRGGRYEDADLFEKPKYKKEDWKKFFKD